MKVLQVRNVCEALSTGVGYLLAEGVREETRAGPALVAPTPVSTVYSHPCERVLFSPVRDANPYFSILESVWMLSGRNDGAFLDNYVKDFSSRFAEPGGQIHGAYGHRWRHAFGFDQLDVIVEKLKKNKGDRQCVLQMWDGSEKATCYAGECDPVIHGGYEDLRGNWKDRCCNTHVYFRVRDSRLRHMLDDPTYVLDMTVCCRSNDFVWGLAGANAVHFSILIEYMAARIGVEIGTYTQMSNNLHIYVKELDRLLARQLIARPGYTNPTSLAKDLLDDRYTAQTVAPPVNLVTDPLTFDADLKILVNSIDILHADKDPLKYVKADYYEGVQKLKNKFLTNVVWQAAFAHRLYRLNLLKEAGFIAKGIMAPDWRAACVEWLERRFK